MRADLELVHREAVTELHNHRNHQHPWAGLDDGWVLSRTRSGGFTLETMGNLRMAQDTGGGWTPAVSAVDVTDRNQWLPGLAPPGYMLRMWANQHGGIEAAARTHPDLADDLHAADRDTRTGIVDLGPVDGFGLTGSPGTDWALGDTRPNAAPLQHLADVQAALPDQCWIEGTMVKGLPSTDLNEILAVGAQLQAAGHVDLRGHPPLTSADPLTGAAAAPSERGR